MRVCHTRVGVWVCGLWWSGVVRGGTDGIYGFPGCLFRLVWWWVGGWVGGVWCVVVCVGRRRGGGSWGGVGWGGVVQINVSAPTRTSRQSTHRMRTSRALMGSHTAVNTAGPNYGERSAIRTHTDVSAHQRAVPAIVTEGVWSVEDTSK